MKIVAQVNEDYLCQVSLTEISIIIGYGQYPNYGGAGEYFKKIKDGHSRLKAGTTIDITQGFSFVRQLTENETKLKSSANVLRQLADMIESGIPTMIVPPEQPIEELGEMNESPQNLRRRPVPEAAQPVEVESSIRTLLSTLRANADRDTFEVLASATNTYLNAVVRFTGQGSLGAKDMDSLLTVWQIMLDVGKRIGWTTHRDRNRRDFK